MVQTTIRMPDRLYRALKVEAQKRGMTMNAYLLSILWDSVEEKEKEAV